MDDIVDPVVYSLTLAYVTILGGRRGHNLGSPEQCPITSRDRGRAAVERTVLRVTLTKRWFLPKGLLGSPFLFTDFLVYGVVFEE